MAKQRTSIPKQVRANVIGAGIIVGLVLAASVVVLWFTQSRLKLPALFSDNMVLQRRTKAPVWGWAAPGEKVTVSFRGQAVAAMADQDGRWLARLEPLEAGGPYELVVSGRLGKTITVRNVLVGEVWLGSGQSNMRSPVLEANNGRKEASAADFPAIRLFLVEVVPAEKPAENCRGSWVVCTPATAGEFPAVAYYFGRQIHKELQVPVGLIVSAVDSVPCMPWISRPTLESDPDLAGIFPVWEKMKEARAQGVAEYEAKQALWEKECQQARAEGKPLPKELPKLTNFQLLGPAHLYNGMISPLMPYAIAGVLWYQGEYDVYFSPQKYGEFLKALIQSWRNDWGQGDFPFLIVQLHSYGQSSLDPEDKGNWASIRLSQLMTMEETPRTALAVTIDLGDADRMHPRNKQEIGRRLALAAQALAYGQKIVYSGPLPDQAYAKDDMIYVLLKNTGSGLATRDGGPLKGFALAGADGKFFWAEARIDGDVVLVRSDKVPKPKAVRYAWAENPEGCNLCNKEGLPASPFRAALP
jgi:sialate O-acetylesterase